MPQPLPTKKDLSLTIGKLALESRPDLAIQIAHVAAAWGHLERQIELLVLVMLGTEARIGHAIYSALTGSGAQRATIDAIAKVTLSETEQEALTKIWSDFSARGKERNRVVHGIWAKCDEFPKHIILMDLEPWIAALARFEAKASKSDADLAAIEKARSTGKHLLYSLKDFEDVQDRMVKLASRVGVLALQIRQRIPIKGADDTPSNG